MEFVSTITRTTLKLWYLFYDNFLTRQAVGLPATFQAVGGGIFLPPLYVFHNNSGTRRDSDAKIGTHQAEYLAHMCAKFWFDPINSDVTVTS